MKIEVDVSKLIKEKLDFESYCFLYLLHNNKQDLIINYSKLNKFRTEALDNLVKQGYIHNSEKGDKYKLSKITMSSKFKDLFLTEAQKEGVSAWIDQWYDLFPKGAKSGGYAIRTDKPGCLKKLEKFVNNNPTYTKGIIIAATKKYIETMKNKNYSYMKLAPYYIEKDGVSMLAGDCEQLLHSVNEPEKKGFQDDI